MSGDSWGEWDESFWAHAIEKAEEIISLTAISKTKNPNPPLSSSGFSPPRELSLSQNPNTNPTRNTNTAAHPIPIQLDDDDDPFVTTKPHKPQHLFQNKEPQCPIIVPGATISIASPERRLAGNGVNPNALHPKHLHLNGSSSSAKLPSVVDSMPTISNKHPPVQKIVVPETTPQPKCTKAIGVQTDASDGYGSVSEYDDDLHTQPLASIWGLPTSQAAQTSLVSNLFLTCASDFYALFRCMGMSMPSSFESLCIPDVNIHTHVQSLGAAKVAHLYYILVKINNGTTQLNGLVDALVDLSTLDNVVLVHGSLRILRAVLQLVLGPDATSRQRDNVTIEGMYPNSNSVGTSKSPNVHNRVQFGVTSCSVQSFDVDMLCNNRDGASKSMEFLSAIDLLSLFETIHQISVAAKEDSVQVEAISVMNLILTRTNPLLEREKFGSGLLFDSLSRLLQKDVCLQVQKQSVHLLFLLLNCPKILALFCSRCKDGASFEIAPDSTEEASASQGFSTILEGLAECVKRRGHGTQELKLRQLSIKVLAFVASSGKSGFEVFLNSKVLKGCNFLELIMQALASEIDAEAAESSVPLETCKERTSLIRESLILLNRLASGPAYSGAVLQVLTSSRDMVSLTIDVVNRMSKKGTDLWKSDSRGKRKAEDEVLDLARALRSRVFAYLGNTSS